MSQLRRIVFGGILACLAMAGYPAVSSVGIPALGGALEGATRWELFVDFGIFWVCATECPAGAEGSEYCCWLPGNE